MPISISCANWSLFQQNWMQRLITKKFLVLFQLFSLPKSNFTPRIIRVLRAFRLIWSSISSPNCTIFLEYSSNIELISLLSSSYYFNLLALFSASVLVSLTLVSISLNLLFSWSNYLFIVPLILVVSLTALVEVAWAKNDLSSSVIFFM